MADKDNDGKRGKQKRKHLPERPKKPASGYIAFVTAYFKKNPAKGPIEARDRMRRASASWSKLSANEKKKYNDSTARAKAKYEKDMNTWKKQRDALKRPPNSYALFVKQTWEEQSQNEERLVGPEFVRHCGKSWHRLADADRTGFEEHYNNARQEYMQQQASLDDGTLTLNALVKQFDAATRNPRGGNRRRSGRVAQALDGSDDEEEGDTSGEEEDQDDNEEQEEDEEMEVEMD